MKIIIRIFVSILALFLLEKYRCFLKNNPEPPFHPVGRPHHGYHIYAGDKFKI